MKVFKDLVTGKDGETHDVLRWLALISVVEALALQTYVVVWKGQPFDLQAFGIGIGAVLVAAGAALKLKADTEP